MGSDITDQRFEGGRSDVKVAISELGALRIWSDGRWTAVRGDRSATVLAVLCIRGTDGARSEELLDAGWPEPSRPDTARQSLANLISRLRKAYGPDFIEITGFGYRIGPTVSSDRTVFDESVRAALQVLPSSAAGALELLDLAESRWRGEPWVGIDVDQVIADRAELHSLALVASRVRAQAVAALGEHDQAVPLLERVVGSNPLDEAMWRLLVNSLAACGRRVEALRVITQARKALADSGLELGSSLLILEQELLGGGLSSTAVLSPTFPRPRTPFVGRIEELAFLDRALGSRRLVTIQGAGGAGKTRLALEAARQSFAYRQRGFVNLVDSSSSIEVDQAIARGLGISPDQIEALSKDERRRVVVERSSLFDGILVVDNCEHLIDEIAPIINQMLDSAESMVVLATSRMPLGVGGEFLFQIPELAESTELAIDRAAIWGLSEPTELDRGVLAEICALVDHLPLAIELAAAQLPYRSVTEIASELRTGRVHRDISQVDPRHETMTATIQWSHGFLPGPEASAFLRLGVFPGPFDQGDAAGVLAIDESAVVLDGFVRRSLVERSNTNSAQDGEISVYRLLAPVRQFALSRLRDESGEQVTMLALADWFLEVSDRPFGDCWWRWSVARELGPRIPAALLAIQVLREVGRTDDALILASRFAGPAHLFGFGLVFADLIDELVSQAGSTEVEADGLLGQCVAAIGCGRNDIFNPTLGRLANLEGLETVQASIFAVRMEALVTMWFEFFEGKPQAQSRELLDEARRREAIFGSPHDLVAIELFENWRHLLAGRWKEAVEAGRRASVPLGNDSAFDSIIGGGTGLALIHLGQADKALDLVQHHHARNRVSYWGDPLGLVEAIGLVMVGKIHAGLECLGRLHDKAMLSSFHTDVEDVALALAFVALSLGREDLALRLIENGVTGRGPATGHLSKLICDQLDIPLVAKFMLDRQEMSVHLRTAVSEALVELRQPVSGQ